MFDEVDVTGEPYPGLRSFRRDETHIFFGRETTINDMVDRLALHRFLAVTGSSGSGKSSLARTGLLDALTRGLLAEAGTDWRIADFRPGGRPLFALAGALTAAVGAIQSDNEHALVEAKLSRGPLSLVEWLDEMQLSASTNLLLLVDQFEEIFRYRASGPGDDVNTFVALLLASAKQRKRQIFVVITMRSDFLGECSRFSGLAESINDGQFLTPRLTRDQCRAAIERPAAVYGGSIEAALVTRMLNDMGANADQLPLMQHVLMLMWHRAAGGNGSSPKQLTLAEYEKLGGIGTGRPDAEMAAMADGKRLSGATRFFDRLRQSLRTGRWPPAHSEVAAKPATEGPSVNGALSNHADQVLALLTPEQQRLAAIMFRALTESEGVGGRDVRRPATLVELAAIADVPVEVLEPVIKPFRGPSTNFLTPPDPIPLTPGKIDITHESLIRQWVTLKQWVRDEFQSAEEYRDIERGAKQWTKGLGNLLARVDLAVAHRWRETQRPNAAWAKRYGDSFPLAMQFIHKSELNRLWRYASSAGTVVALALLIGAVGLYIISFNLSALPYSNPGNEFTDYKVPAQATLRKNVGTNTPLTIPGARVISTLALDAALASGTIDGAHFVLIDALKADHTDSLPNAERMPDAGAFGNFSDNIQSKLADDFGKLTQNKMDTPLIFFCEGSTCWESYNAALRAFNIGYTDVYWYRGGLSAWIAAHSPYDVTHIDTSQIHVKLRNLLANASQIFLPMRNRNPAKNGAAQNTPKDAAAYYARGQDYQKNNDCNEALTDFRTAIRLGWKTADVFISSGRCFAIEKDYADAIAVLNQAAVLDPQDANAFLVRGLVFQINKDYDKAILDFITVTTLAPDHVNGFYELAYAYKLKSDYEHAIRAYSKAINIDSRNASYYDERGRVYAEMNNYDDAIKDYTEAIRLKGDYADYYIDRANAYSEESQDKSITSEDQKKDLREKALADYNKANVIDPKSVLAAYNRGLQYANQSDYDHAIKDYLEAIQDDSTYALAYYQLGYTYLRKLDYDNATKYLTQAIKYDPKYYRSYERRGQAYLYERNLASAIRDLDRAIDLQPIEDELYQYRGHTNLFLGRFGAAADDFVAAMKIDPQYPYYAIWLHMARVREGINDASELAVNANSYDHSQWPAPIFALFLGSMNLDALFAAAQTAGGTVPQQGQICEANFYAGFYQAAQGKRDEATRLFQAVGSNCPQGYIEYKLAPIELDRLTKAN
ncbi:MAG: tetratricopeptide repeat protein [Xanthobacteraceae bacterium]